MKRELQDKKRYLQYGSLRLKILPFKIKNYKKQLEIREQQNDMYSRLKFIENFEKASRKVIDNVKG